MSRAPPPPPGWNTLYKTNVLGRFLEPASTSKCTQKWKISDLLPIFMEFNGIALNSIKFHENGPNGVPRAPPPPPGWKTLHKTNVLGRFLEPASTSKCTQKWKITDLLPIFTEFSGNPVFAAHSAAFRHFGLPGPSGNLPRTFVLCRYFTPVEQGRRLRPNGAVLVGFNQISLIFIRNHRKRGKSTKTRKRGGRDRAPGRAPGRPRRGPLFIM